MKNSIIFILTFLYVISVSAQRNNLSCLELTEDKISSIKIVDDTDLNALQVFEKMKFLKKTTSNSKSISFNEKGDVISTTVLNHHENVFPEWYVPATEIQTTDIGVISYYDNDSKYLTGGWPGGRPNNDPYMEYGIEDKTRRRYGLRKYSDQQSESYRAFNQRMKSAGLTSFYVFDTPKTSDLDDFKKQGYRVFLDKDLVSIENSEHLISWDSNNLVFTQTYFGPSGVTQINTSTYQYNKDLNENLIVKNQTVDFLVFTTGDCYEEVSTTYYYDYKSDCNGSSPRSKIAKLESEFAIYPNPADEQITISLPAFDGITIIEVRDMSGKLLRSQKSTSSSASLSVRLDDFPDGLYIVQLTQAGNVFSKKFIKN